jgi:tetratricopeptide (TPR) repeat protein
VFHFSFRHLSRRAPAILVAVCATLSLFPGVRADDTIAEKNPPSFTNDKTGETLASLPEMLNNKNYDGALQVLNALLPNVDASSYDMAVIDDTIAKVYFQGKDNPAKSIEYWEKMWALLKQHPDYMEGKDLVDHYEFTAQAYFMVATALKSGDARQGPLFDKSIEYMKKWLAATPKPKPQERLFVTELYYYKALNGGSDKPDAEAMKETKIQAEEALVTEVRPREIYYQILFQIAQQQSDYLAAAKYLEWLVQIHPSSKDYWQQLMAVYNNLAGASEKDPRQQRVYYARAINSMERAQALGFSNLPKDNFNLVTLYNQVGQFAKAADIMHGGLKDGKIEDTRKNWEILSYFYRLMGRDLQAAEILKEAAALDKYSASGELYREIAEIYMSQDDTEHAYEFSKKAVEKGNFEAKPFLSYQYLAYSAYQLGKYDEALQACTKALELPGAPQDLAKLKEGIEQAIKQRDQEKAMIKAQLK